jgi:hypothetical protein
MIVDDDVLEKEDMYILERMKAFITNEEVSCFAAAKSLLILIERSVCRPHFLSRNVTLIFLTATRRRCYD